MPNFMCVYAYDRARTHEHQLYELDAVTLCVCVKPSEIEAQEEILLILLIIYYSERPCAMLNYTWANIRMLGINRRMKNEKKKTSKFPSKCEAAFMFSASSIRWRLF